jgi:sulfur relay (sulfurtransferase) DsrC/TusE family protein
MNIFESLRKDHDLQPDLARGSTQIHGDSLSKDEVSLSEELGQEHWRIVNPLREHYLGQGKLPVAKQIRHRLDVEEGCVGRCFGEEARAYVETAEQPGPAD